MDSLEEVVDSDEFVDGIDLDKLETECNGWPDLDDVEKVFLLARVASSPPEENGAHGTRVRIPVRDRC
jgi:hypothetical protein